MHRFRPALVPGSKVPYRTWTFVVIPKEIAAAWGPGQKAIRGSIAGHAFRGTASRGEGVTRMPLTREFREAAGLGCGDTVDVVLELEQEPRPVDVPTELRAALRADPGAAAAYEALPPSCRRAWAEYVADAKRPETRALRADRAPAGIRARKYPR
jgi:hypothetical protein